MSMSFIILNGIGGIVVIEIEITIAITIPAPIDMKGMFFSIIDKWKILEEAEASSVWQLILFS